MARKRQARRCSATNRSGLPCGNFSVLGARVCGKHGASAPQVRRSARAALNTDLAARLLASMRGDFHSDGRIGPREYSAYGLLPPSRRETYLDDRYRLRLTHDPLAQAALRIARADLEARSTVRFREGYSPHGGRDSGRFR